MQTPLLSVDREQVLTRIESAIHELETLRRQLITPVVTAGNLTEQLFGALGHGSWEEYDLNLDWAMSCTRANGKSSEQSVLAD
ncbi:MAG: hypothetical protein HZB52_04665 [Chloroflexi bacterium]|nr:hypothetical protein [Chloroflexota bacterium]